MSLTSAVGAILVLLAIGVWILWRVSSRVAEIAACVSSMQAAIVQQMAARYPMFSAEQIAHSAEERRKLAEQYAERLELVSSRKDDLEMISREGAEDIWVHAQADHAEKLHDFMVQANLAILNGTKTLAQVRDEWSLLYMGPEWMTQAFKEQNEWREKIAGYAQPGLRPSNPA